MSEMSDYSRPFSADSEKRSPRCVTCFFNPDKSSWHTSKINPRITICEWIDPWGWYDSHHHSHRSHDRIERTKEEIEH